MRKGSCAITHIGDTCPNHNPISYYRNPTFYYDYRYLGPFWMEGQAVRVKASLCCTWGYALTVCCVLTSCAWTSGLHSSWGRLTGWKVGPQVFLHSEEAARNPKGRFGFQPLRFSRRRPGSCVLPADIPKPQVPTIWGTRAPRALYSRYLGG